MNPRRIVVGGKDCPCHADVTTWQEHGLEFKPGHGARKRLPKITPIDLFVLHVTGGENPPRTLYDVLCGRGLGVEFAIDVDGLIWQFCDPLLVDTFDAGFINDRSVGVEIVNYGYVKPGTKPPRRGVDREKYDTIIHGKELSMARSNNAQHAALVALADALTACPELSIPRKLPRDADGAMRFDVMTREEVDAHKGVIGHLHITAKKIDPGTDVFTTLDYAGYQ